MRLFGTLKAIELYVILTAMILLYSFDQLCDKSRADMTKYWLGQYHGDDVSTQAPISKVNATSKSVISDEAKEGFKAIYVGTANTTTSTTTTTSAPTTTAAPPVTEAPIETTTELRFEPAIREPPLHPMSQNNEVHEPPLHSMSRDNEATVSPLHVMNRNNEINDNRTPVGGVILPTDPSAKPEVVSSEAKNNQVLVDEKRSRRIRSTNDIVYNTRTPMKPNQTYVGTYRCEKAAPLSYGNVTPLGSRDTYDKLFVFRFFAIFLLVVHLILVLYHSAVNFMHRIPTSHRFNRIIAVIGLIIWNSITFWILYCYFTWHLMFRRSPFIPDYPHQFLIFLLLSLAMNSLLLYEIIVPTVFFTSYNVTPRYPGLGYTPAAKSENEYINGIIRELEGTPADTFESVTTRR